MLPETLIEFERLSWWDEATEIMYVILYGQKDTAHVSALARDAPHRHNYLPPKVPHFYNATLRTSTSPFTLVTFSYY